MTIRVPNVADLRGKLRSRVVDALREQMESVKQSVTQKTQSGIDADGSAFARYSPSYEAFKRKKLGQSGQPNLRLTGEMLNSLEVEVSQGQNEITGKVKVTGSFNQQKARWNQGEGDAPTRKFMGIDSQTKRNLITAIKESIIKGR